MVVVRMGCEDIYWVELSLVVVQWWAPLWSLWTFVKCSEWKFLLCMMDITLILGVCLTVFSFIYWYSNNFPARCFHSIVTCGITYFLVLHKSVIRICSSLKQLCTSQTHWSSCKLLQFILCSCFQINCMCTHVDITIDQTTVCTCLSARAQSLMVLQYYMEVEAASTQRNNQHFELSTELWRRYHHFIYSYYLL
jgi:hypothetical protein